MNRAHVASSMMRSVGYDAATAILEVEFLHGGVYRYFDVPPVVHDDLLAAPSKGRFFRTHIRGSFHFERIVHA